MSSKTFEIQLPRVEIKVGTPPIHTLQACRQCLGGLKSKRKLFGGPEGFSIACGLEGSKKNRDFGKLFSGELGMEAGNRPCIGVLVSLECPVGILRGAQLAGCLS